MPEWIHNRAEHLLAKNPSMKKETAFAVATQQSHALGKSPKGYGTAEGKREAKAKYDTPKDDKKTANPGGLDSPKLAMIRKLSQDDSYLDLAGDGELPKVKQESYIPPFKKHKFASAMYESFFDELNTLVASGQVKLAGFSPRERALEIAGLGAIALGPASDMVARHRARKAGLDPANLSEHGLDQYQPIKHEHHAPLDLLGLGTLAAPYASKTVQKLISKGASQRKEAGLKEVLMTDVSPALPFLKGKSLLDPIASMSRGMKSTPPASTVRRVRKATQGPRSYDVSQQAREMGL